MMRGPVKSLWKNRRGSGGVIVVLISMMVMLLVGIIVVNSLINSQTPDETWSADANTTWENTQTNIWVAFGLVVVGIIIVGAMAIIGYLGGGKGPQGL